MNKNALVVSLILSSLILGGCNFLGFGKQDVPDDGNKPKPTPFQKEYDLDQQSEDGNYKIDLSKDDYKKVGFEVRGVDNKLNKGSINIKSGSAVVEDGILKSAEIMLDMTTLKVDPVNMTIETAIKSSDYFDVTNNSELKLTIVPGDEIPPSPNDDLNFEALGGLTIRGQSKEVEFDSSIVEISENVIRVAGDVDINMVNFGSPADNNMLKTRFVIVTNFHFIKG
ncbi:YceI family protein [Candidatus Dojkabacteria bacterium]|nr:YceI family protein [Candidatus Dojkabacteria bacterium]